MKIGIMTFPNSTSYGAVMQMYALFRALQKNGGDVEVINYQNMYMKHEKHMHANKQTNKLYRKIRLLIRRLMHIRKYIGFKKFEKIFTFYPPKVINSVEKIQELKDRYDAVICGSDQVWNPQITDSDVSYYLDFCGENTRKISYAPSFGNVSYSYGMKKIIKKELDTFDNISVREKEGQEFLMQLDVPSTLVLDPTFLLTKEDWNQIEEECPIPNAPYYLYYTVYSSKALLDFCIKQAKKENAEFIFRFKFYNLNSIVFHHKNKKIKC